MDGWGLGRVKPVRIKRYTPFVSSLYTKYSNTTLITCGGVGLPDGQMGNSEVGHLNLGAGRIVYQELQRINVAIKSGEFAANPVLLQAMKYAKEKGKPFTCLIGK
jgi:2,3-bisphosphoglycerate-independent phosphoglycerate mutase